jgi:hypothetical protein
MRKNLVFTLALILAFSTGEKIASSDFSFQVSWPVRHRLSEFQLLLFPRHLKTFQGPVAAMQKFVDRL